MQKIKSFVNGFIYAARGIIHAFKDRNMRIHGIMGVIVIIVAFICDMTVMDLSIVMICVGIVMAGEIINTAIEDICNILRDELGISYSGTTHIRDMAAGAVLTMAIISFIVGLLVFGKYLW